MTPTPVPQAFKGRRIDPLAAWRKYWKVSVLCATAIILLGLPVAWWKGKAVYYTEASVYISPRFIKNLEDDKEFEMQSNSQYREFVQQQVRTINRFDIVQAALDQLGPKRNVFQKARESNRRATERLQGALEIHPVPDTYQITVGLSGDSAAGLAEIVNSVIGVYMKKDRSERFFDIDTTLFNLKAERARLIADISTRETERTQMSQALGVATFSESYVNPYDQLLTASKAALAAAAQKRYEVQAEYDVVDPSKGAESKNALSTLAEDLASKDAGVTSLHANLNVRRTDLLSRTSGMGENHPGRRAASKELEEIDATVQQTQSRLAESHARTILTQRRADLLRAREIEDKLAGEVKRQFADAAKFSEAYMRALSIGNDLERLRKRLDSVEDRLSFLNLELRAPGFVRVFSEARTPEIPIRGGRTKLAVLFAVAGIFIGLIIPLAIDFIDPRIRSADEVGKLLSFAPMGWLVERNAETAQMYGEQMRRLAAGILRDAEAQGSRIFAFSAAAQGSGTTDLLIGVSSELKRLGVKTLVIDANAMHSDSRYGERSHGFAALLKGETELSEAIVPGDSDLPDRIPLGNTGGERLEGLADFRTIASAVPEEYRLILVDVAPLTLSADSDLLVRGADVAVLVVEAESATTDVVRTAARSLERAQPRAAGAVVNRIRTSRLPVAPGGKDAKQSGSRLLTPWLWT